MVSSSEADGLTKALLADIRSNLAATELGERTYQPFGTVTHVVRGDEKGCYITIRRPGLSPWRRFRARYAFRGIRWASIPLLPFALTGGELLSLLGWGAVAVVGVVVADSTAVEVSIGVVGALGSFPVAVFPAQAARKSASRWTAMVWEPDRGSVMAFADVMRRWPLERKLPEEDWARLYELATWTNGTDSEAEAVLAEMTNLLRSAQTDATGARPVRMSRAQLLKAHGRKEEQVRAKEERSAAGALRTIRLLLNESASDRGLAGVLGEVGTLQEVRRIVRQHFRELERLDD